jgi:ankyrin repeat protein
MHFLYFFLCCLLTASNLIAAADEPSLQDLKLIESWLGSPQSSSTPKTKDEEKEEEKPAYQVEHTESEWQRHFLESHEHNRLIPFTIRQQLIDKGYKIIQQIVAHERLEHQIDVFENAGRTFVEASWLQQMPTQKSIKKVFNKSMAWASSFWYGSQEDQEETIAQQKTLQRRAFLESIIAVSWALADRAARLHQYKKDLLITIADPETVLWNLINEYVGLARTTSDGNDNNFAYPTEISHATLKELNSQQIAEAYTIDARFESNAWALPLFPYNNNTIITARLHSDQQNISPEKTIIKLATRAEGLTSLISHVYNTYIYSMQSYQEIREMNGAIYASGIKEYIKREDVHEDPKVLQEFYAPEKRPQLIALIHHIKENQPIAYGPLAYVAQYIIRTDQYSAEAHQAAKDFLLFLQQNCGDKILFSENNVQLDSLIMYRIGDETVVDLTKLSDVPTIIQDQPILLENQKKEVLENQEEEKSIEKKESPQEISSQNIPIQSEEADAPHIMQPETITKLFDAITKKDVDQVTEMLEEHRQLVNVVNQQDASSDLYGRTPLHHAVFAHNLELVALLLKKGASLQAQDRLGRTPLYIAYQFTHRPIIKTLVEAGASINTPAYNKDSVLQTALRRNDFAAYKYFLDHGGDLMLNKKSTLSILYSIIGAAQLPVPKNALDREKIIHEEQIKILQHQTTKNFISQEHRLFSKTYKEFLKKLYSE